MSEIHPQMRKFIETAEKGMSLLGLTDIHSGGVQAARFLAVASRPPKELLPPIHSVEERAIPGPEGEIALRLYRPSDQRALPVLMWFHGGGWVLGDLDGAELVCRTLANRAGCMVISVDYRLAPETRCPGALDDCYAATAWAAGAAKELGIDATRIAVGGDSAGGNLAACVALRARDEGLPLVFQLLIYPVTRADFESRSYTAYAEGYFLTRSAMQWFWECYAPEEGERRNPAVAPIHAKSLAGLPPALIITAEFDPLRDEGEAYGAALAKAGVPVMVRRYEGMIHAFFGAVTEEPTPAVDAAMRHAVGALRAAFARPTIA
jgi:acetyl esterase